MIKRNKQQQHMDLIKKVTKLTWKKTYFPKGEKWYSLILNQLNMKWWNSIKKG
jgi:hypothetical protein